MWKTFIQFRFQNQPFILTQIGTEKLKVDKNLF